MASNTDNEDRLGSSRDLDNHVYGNHNRSVLLVGFNETISLIVRKFDYNSNDILDCRPSSCREA